MFRIIIPVFIALHGLVHLLYAGQSRRLFELRPGMVWPDRSWAFSRLFGQRTVRILASLAYVLAAIGFVVGGIGLFIGQPWSRTVIVASALFSTASIGLFWDATTQKLPDQGLVAVLINLGLVLFGLLLRVPE